MHYILCEDEGSGKQFFEKVAEICGVNCNVESSHGNMHFEETMKKILPKLKDGDKLLLAFDNIGICKNFNPKQIISIARIICDRKNVELWYTMYYCFEEVFLSYSELLRMCEKVSENNDKLVRLLPPLRFVNSSIISQNDYYDRTRNEIQEVINIAERAGINREKFCDALLENVSRELGKSFTIDKSVLGKCWLNLCDDISFKNKNYICNNKCNFIMKNSIRVEKLYDLEKNSICKLHRPFSAFFE